MTDFLITEPDFLTLHWQAGAKGLCGADSTAVQNEDHDFEIMGTTASDSDCVNNDDFGVTIATSTAGDNDQAFIVPQTGADNRSLFREINWGPENETEFECVVAVEALANTDFIIIGLVLTHPATFDPAVDADTCLFVSEQGTDTNWTIEHNVGNVDVTGADTGVLITAERIYHFRIAFDQKRIARYYINEQLVYTAQLPATAGAAFLPFVGVEAGSANECGKLDVAQIAMRRRWGVN